MSEELKKVIQAQRALKAAKEKLTDAERSAISTLCPVKVGDRVKANGYAYDGKLMEIERIRYNEGCDEIGGRFVSTARFIAEGKILRKDGKPSLNNGEYRGILGALPEDE